MVLYVYLYQAICPLRLMILTASHGITPSDNGYFSNMVPGDRCLPGSHPLRTCATLCIRLASINSKVRELLSEFNSLWFGGDLRDRDHPFLGTLWKWNDIVDTEHRRLRLRRRYIESLDRQHNHPRVRADASMPLQTSWYESRPRTYASNSYRTNRYRQGGNLTLHRADIY
jgi:hypothetical protein